MSESILANLSTAIVSLDHNLNVCFINQAAESLLAISANRSLESPLTTLVRGFDSYTPVFYDALQSGQPYTQRLAELSLSTGSTITVDFTITPVSEGECGVEWPRLLLELHPLDRYLRIDRDALFEEHQEIARQMIRGLAHEVKNPLGGIRGSAQLLEKELPDDTLHEYTTIIIEETDRLTLLVDQMLGPRNMPEPRATNIHEILERIAKLLILEAPGLAIHRDYDPSIPELVIDPELMHQALLNVARNGLQSMTGTEKKRLAIATRVERQFTINGIRHRTVLRIDISDNGCGIPDHLKQHLFYPMISGRPGGTGLGLPLAHSVVHQHQGTIEFESEPGATTFHLFIPLEQNT